MIVSEDDKKEARTGTSYIVPVKRENKKLLSFIKTII
jgi:hypothetical protein